MNRILRIIFLNLFLYCAFQFFGGFFETFADYIMFEMKNLIVGIFDMFLIGILSSL